MSKQITYPYEGKDYTLEFTADSIKTMVRGGFRVEDIEEKPIIVIPDLFKGASLAHHSNVKAEKREEMWRKAKRQKKLIPLLIDMFTSTYTAYLGVDDDEEDEGNADWTPNWTPEDA